MNLQCVGRWRKSARVTATSPYLPGKLRRLSMRQLEELIEQAELVHQLERRGVDGVAAEIAQEIGVLLQHHDVDAGAGQQKAQHHAGRAAAGDAAARVDGLGHGASPLTRSCRARFRRRASRPETPSEAGAALGHHVAEQQQRPEASTRTAAPTSMPRSASMP